MQVDCCMLSDQQRKISVHQIEVVTAESQYSTVVLTVVRVMHR